MGRAARFGVGGISGERLYTGRKVARTVSRALFRESDCAPEGNLQEPVRGRKLGRAIATQKETCKNSFEGSSWGPQEETRGNSNVL
eukprot:1852495-Alexandrium_andersonii.AAC.1